ncbi:MAG: hypothetical protein L0229_27610 [Blastocatellia bacterium]|nr:hypothetical protein [Blastocatellia bacterium]
MFEPKKDHPKWLLTLYPYLFFLRYDRETLLKVLTGRLRFHWHYGWESEQEQNDSIDHPDFKYIPGSFIMHESSRSINTGPQHSI